MRGFREARAVISGIAAAAFIGSVMVAVTALADGMPGRHRAPARHHAAAAPPVTPETPAYPQLAGAPPAPTPPPETPPVVVPTAAPDMPTRLSTALRAHECATEEQALAAIEQATMGEDILAVSAALRALLNDESWCDSARRAIRRALVVAQYASAPRNFPDFERKPPDLLPRLSTPDGGPGGPGYTG